MRRIVFGEKQITKSLPLYMQIDIAKIKSIELWSVTYAVAHELRFKMVPVTNNLTF